MNPNKKPKLMFVLIERAAHLIFLNLIFILCCLPVITIGSALTALYAACRAAAKSEPCYRLFFQAFTASFKRATLAWLVLFPFFLFAAISLFASRYMVVPMDIPGIVLSSVLLLATLAVGSMLFLYYSCFEGTLWELFKSAFILIFTHPIQTVLLTLLLWAPLVTLFVSPMAFAKLFSLWLFASFSFSAVAGLLLMSKPFRTMAGEEAN